MDAIARSVQGGRMKNIIKKIMKIYPNSFINSEFELILVPKNNTYFCLADCETELDVKCKMFEFATRCACKDMPYKQLMRNIDFWGMNTVYFNKVFGTSFSREDMKLIYDRLGNGVNRELTVKFIERGYDMNLLKGDE